MTDLPVADFDYSCFEHPIQEALHQYAQRLGELAKDTACDLWEMGRMLAAVQEQLAAAGTGTFLHWIASETGLNYRTAYRLINIYHAFDLDTVSKTRLGPSVLYALAEPSAPPEARVEVVQRAEQGETITPAKVQEIVQSYRQPEPEPQEPPEAPEPEPTEEYKEFERTELLPRLHDAGVADAPQLLSGKQQELVLVPEEQRDEAIASIRQAILRELVACREGKDPESCADELLDIMGQSSGSIALSAHFGIALSAGPLSLADLTAIACQVDGGRLDEMDRNEYLALRKRVLRLVDSLTFSGCGLFEHTLANGQLVYSLLPCEHT